MKISAIVNTLNEEDNIVDCLESLSWVDEIIVVDMNSDDKTKDLAYRFTKNVFNHKRVGYVEPARNFAIKQATGDWIMLLDADERVSKTLAAKLIEVVKEDTVNFVRIPRKNIIFNHHMSHSRWWPDYNVRFFKKGKVEWQNTIHSIPLTLGEGLTLPDSEDLAIIHYNYTSIVDYFDRFHRYSSVTAKQLISEGYQFNLVDLLKKPFAEFLSRFFAGRGYEDGLHGLVLAILQGFQEFVVYLLVWEKQGYTPHRGRPFLIAFQQQIASSLSELRYWLLTLKMELSVKKTTRLFYQLLRKFR